MYWKSLKTNINTYLILSEMRDDMWELYDRIIEEIPEELTVLDSVIGTSWTCVRCERGVGFAKTLKGGKKGLRVDDFNGMKLKDLCRLSKSWNMLESSIGVAAINSAINQKNVIIEEIYYEEKSVFREMEEDFRGKKVAVIGHFPEVEAMKDICGELYILEREPDPGDYPDMACEYILPNMDYVFVTGTAFTNKTMPRLLELSKDAYTVLVGPSSPITSIFMDYGVDRISGTIVNDGEKIWRAVSVGMKMSIFNTGASFVSLIK